MLERSTLIPTFVDETATTAPRTAGTAEEIVGDALGASGATVLSLSVTNVEPRAGGAITGVEVELIGEDGPERRTCYVDGSRSPAEIWVHPDDPYLPALAATTFPHALSTFLARIGIPGTLVHVELVAYRPGRRGVVRAEYDDRTVFVKVVRPDRVRSIVEWHARLRSAGLPVPAVLGWSPSGVIVIESALGTALTSIVGDIDAATLVAETEALRARLASVEGLAAPRRAPVRSRASWYAARLSDRMPQLIDRLRPLSSMAAADVGVPFVAVHGDLHAGQLFVDPESHRITGLIDIDTVALDEPGTDAGAFIAHALASAELARAAGETRRAAGLVELARRGSDSWLAPDSADAISARRHTVGQLLAQAMQLAHAQGHEQAAERLVAAAERVAAGRPPAAAHDEDPLIGATTTPHQGPTA